MAPHRDVAGWIEDRRERVYDAATVVTLRGPAHYPANLFALAASMIATNIEVRIKKPGSLRPSGESTRDFMQRTDPVSYQQCRDAGRF